MKVHSTNYHNTFIEIAEDCPVYEGLPPPLHGDKKSIANLQFEMLRAAPYRYTSDDILFKIHALRKDIPESEHSAAKAAFFSKGQPCFRASPLGKRYGWGVHSNAEGKVAIYGRETPEYEKFLADSTVEKVKGMRSKRK